MALTYDLKSIILIVSGVPISGFGESDAMSWEAAEDSWEMVIGADGEATRSKINNTSGSLTITLSQTSRSNDILDVQRKLDEVINLGRFPVMVKDLNGTTLLVGADCWVKRRPNLTFGKRAQDREWIIDCGNWVANVGGAIL